MANTRQLAIHVQEAQLTGDLTDFPVLITRLGLHNEVVDPTGGNRARADGGDLRAFVMINSVKTAIPLEVAEFAYDSASGAGDAICNIYVKVPSLLVASGADILLEYGDASLTQPAVTDPLGRNAVWSDAAYVTHDLVKDSTGATADAVWTGSINQARTPAGLKAVEMGFTLTGNDTGKITTSFAADQRPISYLATYRYSTNQTVLGYLWTHGDNAMQAINGTRRWEYHRKYNGVDQMWRASNAQASGTNWRQQAAIHDINALASPEQYRDETLLTLNAVGTPSNPIDALTGTLIIGNDSGGATSWRGGIGPLWIWKTVVSTAFIFTRFRMMNNPAAFLSVGTPTALSGGSVTATLAGVLSASLSAGGGGQLFIGAAAPLSPADDASAAASQKFIASGAAQSPRQGASASAGLVWRGSAANLLAALDAFAAASILQAGAAGADLPAPIAAATSSSAIAGVSAVLMQASLGAGEASMRFQGGAVPDLVAALAGIDAASRYFAAGGASLAAPTSFASSSSALAGLIGSLLRAAIAAGEGSFTIAGAADSQLTAPRAALLAAQRIEGPASSVAPGADGSLAGVFIFEGASNAVLSSITPSSFGLVSIAGVASAISRLLRAAGSGGVNLTFIAGAKSFTVTARGRTLSVAERSVKLTPGAGRSTRLQ